MQVTFIGSADAFNSAGRGHSSYWLDGAAVEPLIVDFGGTTLQGIRQAGRDPDELGAVLVTHLHGDHFAGYPFLFITLTFVARRQRPLHVVGPKGTQQRMEDLFRICYGDAISEHSLFEVSWTELSPGEETEVLGARVRAFAAVHVDPPEQALCLRVTGGDGSVVAFSGDTEPCDGLVDCSRAADLLVAECTGMRPPIGAHTTWEHWPELLKRIEARRIVLSHVGADVREDLPGLLERGSLPGPPVELADDGLRLDVAPADAD